jgi:[ribosomal protein S5]-alanine N-acetyltransferase
MDVPVIETQRLRLVPCTLAMLRAMESGDNVALARLAGAIVPEGWPPVDVLLHQVPQQMRALESDANELRWHGRLIVATGELAGVINLKGPPDMRGRVEVGYEILPQRRRQGIAGEALRAMIAWCLKQPGLRVLQARTLPGNGVSAHMLNQAGFERLGPMHDPVIGEMILWELTLRAQEAVPLT